MSLLCEVKGAVYMSVVLGHQGVERGVLCSGGRERCESPAVGLEEDPDMGLCHPDSGLSGTLCSS